MAGSGSLTRDGTWEAPQLQSAASKTTGNQRTEEVSQTSAQTTAPSTSDVQETESSIKDKILNAGKELLQKLQPVVKEKATFLYEKEQTFQASVTRKRPGSGHHCVYPDFDSHSGAGDSVETRQQERKRSAEQESRSGKSGFAGKNILM